MKYTVEDRNDKDRENPVIDRFDSLEAATAFAQEWADDFGCCEIYEDGTPVRHVEAREQGERDNII